MNIEKFVEKRLKANVLRYSNEKYIPGVVIDDDDDDRMIGHISEVLGGKPKEGAWSIRSHSANILHASNISGRKKGSFAVKFLQLFGINISGDFSNEISFDLNKVTSKDLEKKDLYIEILLDELRANDRQKWRSIKRDYVITETYYADDFSIKFHKEGSISAEVGVRANVQVDASLNADWVSDGKIKVTSNDKVPFAVRGFVVKKNL